MERHKVHTINENINGTQNQAYTGTETPSNINGKELEKVGGTEKEIPGNSKEKQ